VNHSDKLIIHFAKIRTLFKILLQYITSAHAIVTSLETTLASHLGYHLRTKDSFNNVLYSNFGELKRIVIILPIIIKKVI